MSPTANKIAYFFQVTPELLIDALPVRTIGMRDDDKAVEYLRLGQAVTLGPSDRNPALVAEGLREEPWDYDWPYYLDDPWEDN